MVTCRLPRCGAIFSTDKRYRYVLTRKIGTSRSAVTFIMLNPSTADETKDDNTITWCKNFAKLSGHGLLYVANLSPLRATHPRDLLEAGPEPPAVWEKNIRWVLEVASRSDLLILAWGNHGAQTDRADKVLRALQQKGHLMYCLDVTGRQQPRHPRGVPHGSAPVLFSAP